MLKWNWPKFKKEKKEPAKKPADKFKVGQKTTKETKGKLTHTDKDRKLKSQAYKILLKPHITEKSSLLASSTKYIFEVAPSANKYSISQAVYGIYNFKPLKINIINQQGKKVHRGRSSGKRKDWKKAIVTLPKGSKIEVYEGV